MEVKFQKPMEIMGPDSNFCLLQLHSHSGQENTSHPLPYSCNKSCAALRLQNIHISQPSLPTTASVQQKPLQFTNLDKDLWPVLILFVGCHEEVARQDRHKTIPFGFEIDGGISSE